MRTVIALITAVMVLAVGCGIPVEENAHTVPVDVGVEFIATPVPTTPPGVTEKVTEYLYFFDESTGKLAYVERTFDATHSRFNSDQEAAQREAIVKGLVEQLVAGPTKAEQARGLRTSWPSDVAVVGVDFTIAGTAIIEITDGSRFDVAPETDRFDAAAELVYTITELPNIGGIRVTSASGGIRLVTDTGTTSPLTPVSRNQYLSVAPEKEPPDDS